jgi:hypothetical protein
MLSRGIAQSPFCLYKQTLTELQRFVVLLQFAFYILENNVFQKQVYYIMYNVANYMLISLFLTSGCICNRILKVCEPYEIFKNL